MLNEGLIVNDTTALVKSEIVNQIRRLGPTTPDELERHYADIYGDRYREALARVRAAKGKSIVSLFELPTVKGNSKVGKIKTELLFIERCLALLKPGGRLGIVLPEGSQFWI